MTYNNLPTPETLTKTVEAVKERGINVIVVNTKEEALTKIRELIPNGAPVMTGGSTTLKQIGMDDVLVSGKHPWKNLKSEILAEKDPAKQSALRKQSTLSDYFLGSVNAITENGEMVIASGTGSQLPAYAFSSTNVIFVAGTQKIAANLDQALKRLHEYVVPLEDNRMKSMGMGGAMVGKIMIFEREAAFLHRKVTLILVNEVLGF
jgi:L-lactate utilization protein LutC